MKNFDLELQKIEEAVNCLKQEVEAYRKKEKEQEATIKSLMESLAAEKAKQKELVTIPKDELEKVKAQKNQLDEFFDRFIGVATPVVDIPIMKQETPKQVVEQDIELTETYIPERIKAPTEEEMEMKKISAYTQNYVEKHGKKKGILGRMAL